MKKYYLASYMAKETDSSWFHGNLWVSVPLFDFLSIQYLKEWAAKEYGMKAPKNVTITGFQRISRRQYDELAKE